ncbi:tetratricopeptide repeat protein [Pseudothermotoga thermarum]|uniref:Tetratricopeptide TPR_1 repeat-containing protein n=1 Tax=Pseudothermotoga thermarum DSM 5069 TaxID=688269 RepID=F7YXC2_9THEM|nr:tetratricopeptide repeat protein [Pseudothermotoga thermarum]AEH51557.1 Tetratricopeptide TPR_1 repeat-containing protein [Pseudothermotoga thermarum DSM 5069]
MKFGFALAFVLLSIVVFAQPIFQISDHEKAEELFVEFRKVRDAEGMRQLIDFLENLDGLFEDPKLLTLLADALVEYGDWGAEEKEKERIFERARKYAEKAIALDPENGRAYYVAGAAIGRLAQYRGIIVSLFMLGDFDKYMNKAVELLDDPLYKSFALIALGMRYRDVPWPLNDYKESEKKFFEALKYTPNFPNIYLELGFLYLKTKQTQKAIEMFEKVISSEPHPLLLAIHEEAIKTAKEELEKLK